ncbi:hypothetical protein GJ744_005318 [Endocarpon pusillum]|uniref:Uncharacterized protein n=1 Tax=Endocarpon pusillum TaxID=364733 RepID=A0A8H7AQF2_9EURO|nr:hypothetical protein GJ744_005318 [Endocarpon pusillum]
MPSPNSVLVSRQKRKRHRSDSHVLERPHKSRRTFFATTTSSLPLTNLQRAQGTFEQTASSTKATGYCADSEAEPEALQRRKRQRTESAAASSTMYDWIAGLPKEFESPPEQFEGVSGLDTMSGAPSSKRTRSNSSASELPLPSDGQTNTTVSRERKNSIYKNTRYVAEMESNGSFMREAEHKLSPEECGLFETLKNKPLPHDPMLEPEHICQLRELLRDRSELRVCIELHLHLVPPGGAPGTTAS